MLSTMKSLYFSDTGRDTTIVFIGTLVNVIAGGLFFVLVPRLLGPQDYGIFATVVSTAVLLITIANFGIDTGILRFAKKDTGEFFRILTLAFKAYIIIGVSVATLGFVFSPLIAKLINTNQATNLLRIAFAGSIFVLLTNYFTAALQARSDFLKASLVNIFGNLTRLAILLIAIWFFKLNLIGFTIIFFLTPIASVVLGFLMSPIQFRSLTKRESWNFFKFNSWIALALVISSIPYENYFLINTVGPVQTGIYAAPFKVLTFAYMFGGNFTRVLASRFSSFDTNTKARSFSTKALPITLLFSLVILATIPFSNLIITLLFTEAFQKSVPIYQILSTGFIFFFLSTIPSSVIIYYLGKSRISFIVTALKYVFFLTLMIILVPKYFAVGAAIAFSASELMSLLIMSTYSYLKLRK